MKKKLLYLSVLASVVLFSGCGGSSGSVVDTTPPKFTNSTFITEVNEGEVATVKLETDDPKAVFSVNSMDANISGSILTFKAPQVTKDEDFNILVTATDIEGNSKEQKFTFRVKNLPNHIKVASIGDKEFTVLESDNSNLKNILRDSEGLIWRDKRSDDDLGELLSHSEAVDYCSQKSYNGKSFRLPSRTELLNLINYEKTHDLNATLLDNDFTYNAIDQVIGVWSKTDGYYVHTVGGVDARESDPNRKHAVICVQGDEESEHNISVLSNTVVDNSTGYEWTKVALDKNATYSTAPNICSGDFKVPNINDLRSLFDYSKNTLKGVVSDGTSLTIWSDTEDPKDSSKAYVIQLESNSSLTVAPKTEVYSVICVKKPQP